MVTLISLVFALVVLTILKLRRDREQRDYGCQLPETAGGRRAGAT